MSKKTATTYVVLVPDMWRWDGKQHVRSIRVDRCRSNKPSLARGEIVVKVNLHFEEQSLIDAIPEVNIDVANFAVGQDAPEAEVVAA